MCRRAIAVLALLVPLAGAGAAQADSVLVLKDGRVSTRQESFAGPTDFPSASAAVPRARIAATGKPPRGRPTREALDGLLAAGQIDQAAHDTRMAVLDDALGAYSALSGTRKLQMAAVIDNTDAIAAAGQLAPRLEPVFLTLAANAEWWRTGTLLKNGARVRVGDSPLVWQYYAGQGIQLQMLANFGKANSFWSGKKPKSLRLMIDALMPLAVDRGGWPAWEYYFKFGGGSPPWTSSLSQGTAVQVLARAGQMLGDPSLMSFGVSALAAFEQPTPAGVRVDTEPGPWYAIYSFAPGLRVLNAHIQALVGLYDFGQIAGDPRAQGLFQQGDAAAQAVLASYDTGLWSMYSQERESDLSYHNLVTEFLRNLCKRTATPAYCDTAARFKSYLRVAPTVEPATFVIRAGAPAKIKFTLDKISRVAMVVAQGDRAVLSTSATVGRGERFFTWSRPASPGIYELRTTATDLAGNRGATKGVRLRILKPRKKKR